jgi:glycosyltransferase involved in cell wall biosynthesis
MKNILVLNFFPAFSPASSGGELRLVNLYQALSRTHNVTMLTSTDFGARFEEILHTPQLRELRFPKDEFWRSAYQTLERSGVRGELSGLAFALAVSDPACRLRQVAREFAANADLVIHEFPFSEPIFSDECPCPEIYNSHNFEASLLSSIAHGDGFEAALLKLIRMERNLVARARRVFATSATDAEKFRLFYGADPAKLGVCPNGFDDADLRPVVAARAAGRRQAGHRPRLLFTGSGHHPNVEAALFLIELAGEVPECEFVLAGGLCRAISARPLPTNVVLFGPFDAAHKARLLTEADLYLNPVVLGSGTSLKALEALGSAIPMISTPEGVRGLDLEAGVHCEIVSRDEFADAIRRLVRDADGCDGMAASGLILARERFSWNRIAADLETSIQEAGVVRVARPLVLALNDYPVLQPGTGGVARIRNLLAHIDCDVVLVSFGPTFEVALISAGVLHVTVPKSATHQGFGDEMNSGQPMSANDSIASLFAASNRALLEVVSDIARRASAAVFEHPYMAPLLDALAAVRPGLPVIYSAHNVEATHKAQILRGHSIRNTLVTFITELERRLAAEAALVVCCTEADAAHFAAAGAQTIVAPNGCTMPDERVLREAREAPRAGSGPRLGFLGSGHGPNAEAAQYILRELVTAFPDARFEFVGSVCGALTGALPPNVILHGVVSEAAKTSIMAGWDIALNPIQSGGGSSLKLPDYLAHGIPTLSTPAGARSFPVVEHGAGHTVARRQFSNSLAEMLAAPDMLALQRVKARRYAAKELAWDAITAEYRQRLHLLMKAPPAPAATPSLLVVTYRYTEPPLGGAEEYLIEVLKRARPIFGRIDLAAIDVDHLTNQHHFGCRMSTAQGGASLRLGELFDQSLYFTPDKVSEDEMFARSQDLERAWTREERSLLAPFAAHLAGPERLRVFAGFYWPENHGGVIRRWTSPEFSFLVPIAACAFHMSGYASAEKTLRVTLMQVALNGDMEVLAVHQQTIPSHFAINITLPKASGDQPLLLSCEVDEHQAAGDHRPFGVLVETASVLLDRNGGWRGDREGMAPLATSTADLTEQHDQELSTKHFDRWVGALHNTAQRRSVEMEADFAATRGPRSGALQDWLAAHASDYDSVLVQGIPFDVIPRTVETLARLLHRPRLVTLPHFHGDDRFYHWRRYFESFEAADATLLFSSSIAERLGSSERFAVIPGGGVRAEEHGDLAAEKSFRAVHQDPTPFFLVLGRKTASKGYEQAIRAQQQLRRSGIMVDLVLIGPDEDGRAVEGAGVHYLGRQPREVIRGALATCLALVTMSRSESFGIVLCEAWLFGKPVIANRACYSFRELVRDGETGLLATTEQQLSIAMRRLFDQPNERERMGNAGFEETLKKFTWEKVTESLLRVQLPLDRNIEIGPKLVELTVNC